ncbi:CDGSH iron-sulfur domain-containing protein [Halanaeroarchaeum sulfurireducens]|uniref:Zinc finger CDGSH-type domain-containing protein n=1 Tax=Halanaeroarchaeum sulfurireducens TaxID=1604004 RepID=A0A0F7PB07_9EURY|nr:CDGSH iron-sulfur domain-containing protein [Halanaeroarchaeum sulfurireducens]AKH98341.1 zinc finger CDGSH-type domain-containing protein [Halanaeroarchaeum sulfurireducens]ALG82735.1 zinc finger CDGSH-type domain-containing protein [Halanaeroarchaeum sulfurireducens]
MTREITHDATEPKMLDEEEIDERGTVAICMCGLSADYPFCDGSHAATADEDSDVLYKYEGDDDENPRHEIAEIVYAEED